MSDNTLDGLIAKVKSEAIDAAEKEANQIIENAKKKAEQLLKNAEIDKVQLLDDAKTQADASLSKGKIALTQAARDVQIAVKNDLLKLFKSVLDAEVKGAFSADVYSNVITKIVATLGENIDIALPSDTEDRIVASVRKQVAESDKTVHILKKEQLLSGLSVTKTDEGWSYDITSEEVSELLSRHLNHKWVKLLSGD